MLEAAESVGSDPSGEGLPEGWISTTMGEVAKVVGGGTPKSSDSLNFANVGHPWITPADLGGFEDTYISRGRRDLSDKGLRTCSATVMPAGTVLMSSRAPIGYLAIASGPVSTNQGFKSFVCRPEIVPEFVYFWLKSIQKALEEMGSGSTFAEISGSRAKEIPILLAPAAEQRRVADRLQQLLPRVARLRKRLAGVPVILKLFRQSVLAAACSGRLTEDWRSREPRTDGARLLLHNVLSQRYRLLRERLGERKKKSLSRALSEPPTRDELPNIPGTWEWATVDMLSTKVVDGVHHTPEYVTAGISFVTVRNLTAGNDISFERTKFISPEDHARFLERANPERGDLLVTKDGTLGVTRAIRTDLEFSIFVSVALIKVADKRLTDFMELALAAPQIQALMVPTGSGLQHIHLRDLRAVPIPVPSAEEQREIVRRARTLFNLADSLERLVASADARAEKMSQAFLAKAFKGQLVPTEAELARREGRAYEPASELLAKFRERSGGLSQTPKR